MNRALLATILTASVVLFYGAHLAVSDPKPLQLKVSPLVGFAPQDLFIQIRLQPQADDRRLAVICEGEDFGRASELPLEGAQAPRFVSFWWPQVPAGEYTVRAHLGSAWHWRAEALQRVTIVAR